MVIEVEERREEHICLWYLRIDIDRFRSFSSRFLLHGLNPQADLSRQPARVDGRQGEAALLASLASRCTSKVDLYRPTPMTPEDKLNRQRAQRKVWKLANAERVKAQAQAWYAANVEKSKAQSRAWAQANPDKVNAKNKAWRLANADAIKARAAQKRLDNPSPPRPPRPPRPPAAPALPRAPKPSRSPGEFCGPPTERQHAQTLARIARHAQRRADEAARHVQAVALASPSSAPTPPSDAEMAQRRQAALADAERLLALMRAPAGT